MIYLSSTTNLPDDYKWRQFGVMFNARNPIGDLDRALDENAAWMMDNNAFGGNFDGGRWIDRLVLYRKRSATCLGIPVPDVVGDALATLRLFSQYWRVPADLGYPVAFVSQDGITPEITPWDFFDVLFVGGTDAHKLGPEAMTMIAEAKDRGKRVHVGRVNSAKRINMFWMADSVDGTGLTRERQRHNETAQHQAVKIRRKIELFAAAVDRCNHKKSGALEVNGQYRAVMA